MANVFPRCNCFAYVYLYFTNVSSLDSCDELLWKSRHLCIVNVTVYVDVQTDNTTKLKICQTCVNVVVVIA